MNFLHKYRFLWNLLFSISTFLSIKGEISGFLNCIIGFLIISYFVYSISLNLNSKNKFGVYCDVLTIYIISLFVTLTFYDWNTLNVIISITTVISFFSLIFLLFKKNQVVKYDILLLISILIIHGLKFV